MGEEAKRGVGHLRVEVAALASPEPEVLLALLEHHLDAPAYLIDFQALVEAQRHVCRQ